MQPKPKQNPAEVYRRTEAVTATREALLLMLYSGALRFLKNAKDASACGDNADRNQWIRRAQDIVNELRAVLDFQISPEIATELDRLYAYVTARLVSATLEHDARAIDDALKVLETLNTAWEEAVAALKKQKEE